MSPEQPVRGEPAWSTQAFQAAEAYRLVFEATPHGILFQDAQGAILTANPAAERILGLSLGQLQGRSPADPGWAAVHEDGSPVPVEALPAMAALRTGRPVAGVVLGLVTQAGRGTIWLEVSAVPLFRDGEARPCQVMVTLVDLTDLKRAEATARETRVKLEAALASMNDAVFISDIDGRFIEFNEAFATFHRFASKADCARTFAEYPDILDVFLPDGSLAPVAQWAVPRALRGETATGAEYGLRRKDTGEAWVGSYSFAPIRDAGQRIIGSVVSARDVTAHKREEEALASTTRRLALATASANIGVWDWDLRSGAMTWDDRMLELYGLTREAFQGGVEAWQQGLHPEDLGRALAECEAALRGEAPYATEFRLRHRDGRVLWVKATGLVLRDDAGAPVRMLGLNQDITEQREAQAEILRMSLTLEQRVQERTAQLEAAYREQEAFSYSVSHDLRAPLRGIDGFSQVLLEDYRDRLDEAGRNHLARIRAGVQRMGQLIEDLLKLSRLNRSPLERAEVDLTGLARKVAEGLAQAHPASRVELAIQPGLAARADQRLVQEMLDNLLGNAWKFTSKRPDPRIELGERVGPDGERAFFIRDNGAGFDMAHVGKLFNAFQRLHLVTEFDGTGIGLAIVQRIVHRHGGRIWAEAEVGRGATFYFTLP